MSGTNNEILENISFVRDIACTYYMKHKIPYDSSASDVSTSLNIFVPCLKKRKTEEGPKSSRKLKLSS